MRYTTRYCCCWCYTVGSSQITQQYKAIYFHRNLGNLCYSASVHCTVNNTLCGCCLYKGIPTYLWSESHASVYSFALVAAEELD